MSDPPVVDPDRDARAELPTRHPCPRCGESVDHGCWLCHGFGVTAEQYKAFILAGRPPTKPEGWAP